MHSLPIIIAIIAIAALQVPGNWAGSPSRKTYGNHWYKPKPCPQPAHPQNGTARLFRNNLVKYSCDPDYVLVGRSYRWCFYGKWMGAIPECRGNYNSAQGNTQGGVTNVALFSLAAKIIKKCPDPGTPSYGRRELQSTTVGSVVKYVCMYDFRLVAGDSQRTCLPTGKWSGKLPTCRCKFDSNQSL